MKRRESKRERKVRRRPMRDALDREQPRQEGPLSIACPQAGRITRRGYRRSKRTKWNASEVVKERMATLK
jgi:hypothetical protein